MSNIQSRKFFLFIGFALTIASCKQWFQKMEEDTFVQRKMTETVTESPDLKIAWLMAFPNSGTTYTSKMVQSVSKNSVATNYGHEFIDSDGSLVHVTDSFPVFPESVHGPFRFSNYDLPDSYILTKTHCGGFGYSDSPPREYIRNPETFLNDCTRGVHFTSKYSNGESASGEDFHDHVIREPVQYDFNFVGKVVHMIRNPLDNVVVRFHHEYRLRQLDRKFEVPDWMGAEYALTPPGFHAWCADTDSRYRVEKGNFLGATAMAFLDTVPCHTEIFKYVQWHNLAFVVSRFLGLQSFVVYYEDFELNLKPTVDTLLDYLELPNVFDPPEFKWMEYSSKYYTIEERILIFEYVKSISSEETWSYLKTYVETE